MSERKATYLSILLNKVFDRGVREWITARYNDLVNSGQTPFQAYTATYSDADQLFGPGWKAK